MSTKPSAKAMSAQSADEQEAQTTQPHNYGPMPDVKARISSIAPEGAVRARCSLNIGGHFIVRGVKLVEGKNGPFLSMPGYKLGNDSFQENCYGLSKEFQNKMLDTVLDEYNQALGQAQQAGQRTDGREPPAPFEQASQEAGPQMAAM